MPTFREVAQQYAANVRQAIRQEGASARSLTASSLRYSPIARTFKAIADDLDRYTIQGSPLTEDDKRTILEIAGEELGLDTPAEFYYATRAGSNDAYMQMITY